MIKKIPFGYDKNSEINMLFVWKHSYCICLFCQYLYILLLELNLSSFLQIYKVFGQRRWWEPDPVLYSYRGPWSPGRVLLRPWTAVWCGASCSSCLWGNIWWNGPDRSYRQGIVQWIKTKEILPNVSLLGVIHTEPNTNPT